MVSWVVGSVRNPTWRKGNYDARDLQPAKAVHEQHSLPTGSDSIHSISNSRSISKNSSYSVMCKHVLNAQVAIRAPCCSKWFDCPECHAEKMDHNLARTMEMVFMCKKCKKAFRKDMTVYEESDEYCPNCDNHYVLEAKTPQAVLGVEGEDARVNSKMIKDDRVAHEDERGAFARHQDVSDKVDMRLPYDELEEQQRSTRRR